MHTGCMSELAYGNCRTISRRAEISRTIIRRRREKNTSSAWKENQNNRRTDLDLFNSNN